MVRRPALTALAIVSLLAVTGCGGAAVASVEPTPTPTPGVTPIPTPRPTPRPVLTAPPTPPPSATPAPTPAVLTPEGNAARQGFVRFAGSDRVPFHLVLTSRVVVLSQPVTIRLVLDVSDTGDMAGQLATKAADVTDTADLVIAGGREFVRLAGQDWVELSGDPTTANPLGAVPLDKVAWVGLDTIGGKALHHLQIDDPSVVGASNADQSGLSDLVIETGVMDVWVTADGTPVTAKFRILGSAVARSRPTVVSIVGRYEFSDVGKPVAIEAPIATEAPLS
jgi:hypothetical protein